MPQLVNEKPFTSSVKMVGLMIFKDLVSSLGDIDFLDILLLIWLAFVKDLGEFIRRHRAPASKLKADWSSFRPFAYFWQVNLKLNMFHIQTQA